jgi:HPt (histidine-containing phosphotransfer) domain-containing protein
LCDAGCGIRDAGYGIRDTGCGIRDTVKWVCMIDHKKFDETFQYFDNDVILSIIDLYEKELPGRLDLINKNILEKDFEHLEFNAHSLKSVTGAFMDPVPADLARKLEENARNRVDQDLDGIYAELKLASEALLKELKEMKGTL